MTNELFKRIISSIILIPLVLFFIIKGDFLFNFFIFFCFLITIYEWHLMSKSKNYYYFGIIFLLFSFYTVYKLIDFNGNYINFLFVTLICISTDIGGYIFGKIFKGAKLTKFSPNKTYAGMIGSFLLPLISVKIFFNVSYLFPYGQEITKDIIIFVILISGTSQIGDIIVSSFKRLSKIKDTGRIIPGHGGILDRIDGMIFAFPFAYIILASNILYTIK